MDSPACFPASLNSILKKIIELEITIPTKEIVNNSKASHRTLQLVKAMLIPEVAKGGTRVAVTATPGKADDKFGLTQAIEAATPANTAIAK